MVAALIKKILKKWHEDADDLLQDVTSNEPLPEPVRPQSSIQALSTLLEWFVSFLLVWQATCKISDNSLEWLLRFMFQFLHVMGITCNSDYICQMAFMLPTSLYLLWKFVNLNCDNFVEFAVCPKWASLYQLESCARLVEGQIVSNIWTRKAFTKGRNRECGTALGRKIILVKRAFIHTTFTVKWYMKCFICWTADFEIKWAMIFAVLNAI